MGEQTEVKKGVGADAETKENKKDTKGAKKASTRCIVCRKKNLTNMKCKCGQYVCMTHRFPDSHKCNFNHALYEKSLLRKNLQKVTASKMEVV